MRNVLQRLTFKKIFDSFVGTFGLPFEQRVSMTTDEMFGEQNSLELLKVWKNLKASGCCTYFFQCKGLDFGMGEFWTPWARQPGATTLLEYKHNRKTDFWRFDIFKFPYIFIFSLKYIGL